MSFVKPRRFEGRVNFGWQMGGQNPTLLGPFDYSELLHTGIIIYESRIIMYTKEKNPFGISIKLKNI
jgi:hypothetical protein